MLRSMQLIVVPLTVCFCMHVCTSACASPCVCVFVCPLECCPFCHSCVCLSVRLSTEHSAAICSDVGLLLRIFSSDRSLSLSFSVSVSVCLRRLDVGQHLPRLTRDLIWTIYSCWPAVYILPPLPSDRAWLSTMNTKWVHYNARPRPRYCIAKHSV